MIESLISRVNKEQDEIRKDVMRRRKYFTPDEIVLAISAITDGLSIRAMTRVLGYRENSQTYSFLFRALRQAYKEGRVSFNFKEGVG